MLETTTAVPRHGRSFCTSMATRLLCVALLAATVAGQPSSSFQDLAQPLAAKIAAALAEGDRVTLILAAPQDGDAAALVPVEAEIRRAFAGRSVRTVESGGAAVVRVACSTNLRERACIAELRRADARDVLVVTRPLASGGEWPALLSLELTPIFAARAPILDVSPAGNRLFVLDPERIAVYEQNRPAAALSFERGDAPQEGSARHWAERRSAAVSRSRPWPRDVRGRLRSDDTTVTAWLPGVVCRGSGDLARVVCAEQRESWPLGIENTGIDAARNYFSTPEGLPFYAAAPLDANAGARWVIASTRGELLFVDEARRTAASADQSRGTSLGFTRETAEDVAALDAPCSGGARHLVVASTSATDLQRDILRLYRVANRRLIAVSDPVAVPGRLTALWSAAVAPNTATIVARDERSDRYEAFELRIGCPQA